MDSTVSGRFSFTKENLVRTAKVVLWSSAAAGIAALIAEWANFDISAQYMFIVPIVNSVLYAIKEFVGRQVVIS